MDYGVVIDKGNYSGSRGVNENSSDKIHAECQICEPKKKRKNQAN